MARILVHRRQSPVPGLPSLQSPVWSGVKSRHAGSTWRKVGLGPCNGGGRLVVGRTALGRGHGAGAGRRRRWPRPRRRAAGEPDATGGRHAAAGGPLHQQELLPGREVLARQALHALQHAARADRHGPRPAVRRLGRLQPGPRRGQDRQPAPVQDRAGALRRAAGGGQEGRRADGAHPPDDAGLGRLVPPAGPRRAVGLGPQPPDGHDAVAADAGVPPAHGAAELPRGGEQLAAVDGVVLLPRRLHALVCRSLAGRRHRADGDAAPGAVPVGHRRQPAAPGADRQEARAAGAAVVRRDRRVLERQHAGRVDRQRPGLDAVALDVRVQQQDAGRGDVHARAPTARRLPSRPRSTTRRRSRGRCRW